MEEQTVNPSIAAGDCGPILHEALFNEADYYYVPREGHSIDALVTCPVSGVGNAYAFTDRDERGGGL